MNDIVKRIAGIAAVVLAVVALQYFLPLDSFKNASRIKNAQARSVTPAPGALSADEQATIDVFKNVSSSVVYIRNTAIRRGFFFDVFEVPQGTGSGFVWDKQGHIVTNFHVTYGANAIDVVMHDQSSYKATVVGADPDHDLAVLKIDAPKDKLIPVQVGTSSDLQVGQKALAIGIPFGLDYTLTTGIISAVGRTIKSMTGRTIFDVIQTDAAINPGNSGGPLLDYFGRLIGVNTAIASPSGAYAGVGFAVPVDLVNRTVPELIKFGKTIRPGLGVVLVPESLLARWDIKGAMIAQVSRGSAADKAGLQGIRETIYGEVKRGDVIVGINDVTVERNEDLLNVLEKSSVGDEVTIAYKREGKIEKTILALEEIQ